MNKTHRTAVFSFPRRKSNYGWEEQKSKSAEMAIEGGETKGQGVRRTLEKEGLGTGSQLRLIGER
jgi:hypothetical protein